MHTNSFGVYDQTESVGGIQLISKNNIESNQPASREPFFRSYFLFNQKEPGKRVLH